MDEEVDNLVEVLLQQLVREQKLTDEILRGLHFLFGPVLESALELIDSKRGTVVTSSITKRKFFLFEGKTPDESYFSFSHYCSCPAFKIAVVNKENIIACKHQLANWIITALNSDGAFCKTKEIPEQEYSTIMLGKCEPSAIVNNK